jgi:cell wall-associated NlpC family hydrolase
VAIADFLEARRKNLASNPYKNYMLGNSNSLTSSKLGQSTGGLKFKSPVAGGDTNFGALLSDTVANAASSRAQFQTDYNNQEITDLAADITQKSAGKINTNEFGIPTSTKPDFFSSFKDHLSSINNTGKLALQTEQAKSAYRQAVSMQNLAGFSVVPGTTQFYDANDLPAGASKNNPGAQAVASAMTAYKNHTPYVWGGNSLTGGVDCSGLVQQVYKKLGINLPRTTYQQAKAGKIISTKSLLPGDLVFYNTGSRDPNGIGTYGHVAIYIGNGQVVQAYNTKKGIMVTSLTYAGQPSLGVRPW